MWIRYSITKIEHSSQKSLFREQVKVLASELGFTRVGKNKVLQNVEKIPLTPGPWSMSTSVPCWYVSAMSSTFPGQFWLLGPRVETACHLFIPSFVYSTKMYECLLCSRIQHSLEEPRTPCSCLLFCTACIIIFNEMCQTCLTVHLSWQTLHVQDVLSAFTVVCNAGKCSEIFSEWLNEWHWRHLTLNQANLFLGLFHLPC